MDGFETPITLATDSCCGSLLDQPLDIDYDRCGSKCNAIDNPDPVWHSPLTSWYDDVVPTASSDNLSRTADSGCADSEPTRALFALPVAGASEATLRPLAVLDTTETKHGPEPCSNLQLGLALALDLNTQGGAHEAESSSASSIGSLVDEVMNELASLHASGADTTPAFEITAVVHHVL